MSGQLATRIIDGDGHIMEDNAGIIAHMDPPYREIAQRKASFSPRWIISMPGAQWRRHPSATSGPP